VGSGTPQTEEEKKLTEADRVGYVTTIKGASCWRAKRWQSKP